MGYYSTTKEQWQSFLRISNRDVPDKLIILCSMNSIEDIHNGYPVLENVRRGWNNKLIIGEFENQTIAFNICNGGPEASKIAHIYCKLGVKLIVHIGFCGALREDIDLGDIVVSKRVLSLDKSAELYNHDADHVESDELFIEKAISKLKMVDIKLHVGDVVSYYNMLLERDEDLEKLRLNGYIAVDMESAAIGAVAHLFTTPSLTILTVTDKLLFGKGIFSETNPIEQANIQKGMDALIETALNL
jgi:purine-nucleoside phosphorylase